MRSFLFVVLPVVLASAVACSSGGGRSNDEQAVLANDPGPADAGSPTDGPRPRITSVKALGTGCPNGRTWAATIADDGQSASLELRSYDATINHGDGIAVADCAITVQVASVAGTAYAVGSYESDGFASLRGDGVTGQESVKVYVQGNPLVAETGTKSLSASDGGGDYVFTNTFGSDTKAWSPCGGGRDLNVQSRLVLKNNADKSGQAYVKPATVKLQLQSKSCS
jgi:hypothetical protein